MKNQHIIISILFTVVIAFSCSDKKPKTASVDGSKIYKKNCITCHGLDGKLGINGSKDLTISKLTLDERKVIIKNGKGAMLALGGILDAEEIQAVAEYTLKLK